AVVNNFQKQFWRRRQGQYLRPKTETLLPGQVGTSKSFAFPVGTESPNGFRHFSPFIREESRLVVHTDPYGLTAEQFRILRRSLNQESSTGAVLMITSPGM